MGHARARRRIRRLQRRPVERLVRVTQDRRRFVEHQSVVLEGRHFSKGMACHVLVGHPSPSDEVDLDEIVIDALLFHGKAG